MEFIGYLSNVFTLGNFVLLLFGSLGGLIIGAIPGLSPTLAVALLIPVTFQMDATQGLILLGSVYTSTVAGGAISAILLKIPGAPANVATTLDGHAMACTGKGAQALQLAFLSSLIGGVFGVILLIEITPLLAEWALAIRSSHLFWLAILGVTVIASVSSSSVLKGLLSGSIGLWLSTIGFDDVIGAQRFVFHDAVSGGIELIPALIGLFAIPQVIKIFAKGRKWEGTAVPDVESHPISEAVSELFRRWRALSIGAFVGSFIGIIPGVGGQVAGLVAYDQAKRFSPEAHKFGKGHAEGVVAAEAGNSAMVGPSLAPLLTLAIPGSPTAAVLLGGLLIHGIFPGRDLFENHPDVAWTFISSMLIGQFIMCIFGLYIANLAAQISRVPNAVLAAAVLVLAVFGSYSVQHSMGNVYVMVTLGIGMYFLERFGFSPAPLALGLILGPIAEASFTEGSMIASATSNLWVYFLTGSLNLSLIGIIAISIIYSVLTELRQSRHSTKTLDIFGTGSTKPVIPLKSHFQNIVISGIVASAALFIVYLSYTAEPSDAFLFPQIVSTCFFILSFWEFGRTFLGKVNAVEDLDWIILGNLLPGLLIVLTYVFVAARVLGFYTASALAIFLILAIYDQASNLRRRKWMIYALLTTGFIIFLYNLFSALLGVSPPRGLIF